MKFDGTNWVNVGNARFSAGVAYFLSLAFSPSGQPYVAYDDFENLNKATVMKFDGTNWVNVGNAGFSAAEADYTSLAFSPSGQPFVAFNDWANSFFATVMRYDGNNWVNVGPPAFSAGAVQYTSLAFNSAGQPLVAYEDFGNSRNVTVMKFDSSFMGINEQQASHVSLYPNPAIDKITIETTGSEIETNLTILNLEGQELIMQKTSSPKTTIDISELPEGIYFVWMTNDNGVEVGKIIKQ
jgi:uncharacterized protein YjdB